MGGSHYRDSKYSSGSLVDELRELERGERDSQKEIVSHDRSLVVIHKMNR